MRVSLRLGLVAGLLVVAGGSATAGSHAPARVDDRAVVCVSQVVAGVRKFSVSFSPRLPPAQTLPDGLPAVAAVSSGFVAEADATLVAVSAGPRAVPRVRIGRRCTRSGATVRLSPRGLPGPPVPFQSLVDCALPGRILIRARTVSDGGRVTAAELAVRMERSGAPIAYARIDRDGSGVFYSSPRCS